MSDDTPKAEEELPEPTERQLRIMRFLEMRDDQQKYALLIFDLFIGPVRAVCEELINDVFDVREAREKKRREQRKEGRI